MTDPIRTALRGAALLNDPALNKGTAFSRAERRALGLELLLPWQVETIEQQVERCWGAFAALGSPLERYAWVQTLRERLFGLCTVLTPNLDELGLLVGERITTLDAALQTAQTLIAQGARAVLVKGGHLSGDTLTDTLVDASGVRWQRSAPRLHSRNLHGTGCSLSSAIATHLARGADLVAAVDAAHHWVRQALLAGIDLRLGAGHGPLNHFHHPIALTNLENTDA